MIVSQTHNFLEDIIFLHRRRSRILVEGRPSNNHSVVDGIVSQTPVVYHETCTDSSEENPRFGRRALKNNLWTKVCTKPLSACCLFDSVPSSKLTRMNQPSRTWVLHDVFTRFLPLHPTPILLATKGTYQRRGDVRILGWVESGESQSVTTMMTMTTTTDSFSTKLKLKQWFLANSLHLTFERLQDSNVRKGIRA